MSSNYDDIPTNVDHYTASIEAKFNEEASSSGDPLKDFEDEYMKFFSNPIDSIKINKSDIFHFYGDEFSDFQRTQTSFSECI